MAKQYGNSNEIYKAALSRAGLGEVGVTPIKKKKPVGNEFETLLQDKTLSGIAQGKYGIVDGKKLSNEKKDTKGIIQNWRGYVSDEEIDNRQIPVQIARVFGYGEKMFPAVKK